MKLSSILIFDTHELSNKALFIFHFLEQDASKMRGATSLGFLPLSQGASQKGVNAPLPTVIEVAE